MAQTTISIHSNVQKTAVEYVKKIGIKGGLSGYIQNLLTEDLKSKGYTWDPIEQPKIKK